MFTRSIIAIVIAVHRTSILPLSSVSHHLQFIVVSDLAEDSQVYTAY